ncbi:hypothetical protein BGZ83_001768 [Gryganskiella cystojenkinii]|nr:hypothetical protein BGZ83_001768 [Gryganskiella cystojenkinii]
MTEPPSTHNQQYQPYQTFRERGGSLIRIPITTNQSTGDRYIIWTDIEDCFPNVLRIQQDDIYVPRLRDGTLYRIIPHGIKHQPGIILDVVYKDQIATKTSIRTNEGFEKANRMQRPDLLTPASIWPTGDQQEPPVLHQSDLKSTIGESLPNVTSTADHIEASGPPPQQQQLQRTEQQQSQQSQPSTVVAEKSINTPSMEPDPPQHYPLLPEPSAPKSVAGAMEEPKSSGALEPAPSSNTNQSSTKSKLNVNQVAEVEVTEQHNADESMAKDDSVILREIIGHRIQDIIDRRYQWSESLIPKLFVPVLDMSNLDGKKLSNGLQFEDFDIYFCCDCADLPGMDFVDRPWRPHWIYGGISFGIEPEHEQDLFDIYGEYMMVLCEMLIFGAQLSDDKSIEPPSRSLPALDEPHFIEHRREQLLQISLLLLSKCGVKSSADFLNETRHLSREERAAVIPRVKPLEGKQDCEQLMRFLGGNRPFGLLSPFMTESRDVRWICETHFDILRPSMDIKWHAQFGQDNVLQEPGYDPEFDTFHVFAKTTERAQELYRSLSTLNTCTTRFVLDWTMTPMDHLELAEAISNCNSVAVIVQVQLQTTFETGITGFDKGQNLELGQILLAALENTGIEVFELKRISQSRRYSNEVDAFLILDHIDFDDALAFFKRDTNSGRIEITAKVAEVKMAVGPIRKSVKGFHHISKLHLGLESQADSIDIEFAEPEEVKNARGQVEDRDYLTDGKVADFFSRRGFVDKVKWSCMALSDNPFQHSLVITEMSIWFNLAQDRDTVRLILKENKKLKQLRLDGQTVEVPSQVFESFKALMVNHPAFESLEFRHREYGEIGMWSDFHWRHIRDPNQMEVTILAYEVNKIGSMLQRYTKSISSLTLYGLSTENATLLERSFRLKNGPFKLTEVKIGDPHLWLSSTLDTVVKVVERVDVKNISILGGVPAAQDSSNAITPSQAYVRFIGQVKERLTRLSVSGDGVNRFLHDLNQMQDAQRLTLLTELSISVDFREVERGSPLFSYRWIHKFIMYKSMAQPQSHPPLFQLRLEGVWVSGMDWSTLPKMMNWSILEEFVIIQRNPLPMEALEQLKLIPEGSRMRSFLIDALDPVAGGHEDLRAPSKEDIRACVKVLKDQFSSSEHRQFQILVLEQKLSDMLSRIKKRQQEQGQQALNGGRGAFFQQSGSGSAPSASNTLAETAGSHSDGNSTSKEPILSGNSPMTFEAMVLVLQTLERSLRDLQGQAKKEEERASKWLDTKEKWTVKQDFKTIPLISGSNYARLSTNMGKSIVVINGISE